jgi:hypothetical protein
MNTGISMIQLMHCRDTIFIDKKGIPPFSRKRFLLL